MSASPSRSFDRDEPIPGYRLIERIGRGGYGEVWRAVAPGGLAKAVKVVYGDGDSSQADAELKSLARVKDARHPLLLSIERIEVVDGNLVIVTELADGSLKDRYNERREASESGVPRDELLGYLADVAEALDYLYAKYSLQHLDIKPENILVVGERAKVGDFGLVKSLYERSASLVGGLTPTYASPELFGGRPSRHSDQYGLAIVYMHMLTGTLPFAAANTAQLAAMHLNGVPNLSALPRGERPLIARALSKDPAQRFESCRELIAAIRTVAATEDGAATSTTPPVESSASIDADPIERTVPVEIPTTSTTTARLAGDTVDVADEFSREEGEPTTLFVGLGGTGVTVLSRVVHRLRDRFESAEHWPSSEFVLIDSDAREMSSRLDADDLKHAHVVPIPLEPGETYSTNAGVHLRWLTRRWLYGVPRDRRTDGFRPLGRLAVMTHAERVAREIERAVDRIANRGGDGTPRVVLVGSIGGGTGSGALLDVAYLVRSRLKQRGISDERVHGMLVHATPTGVADRDKVVANSYAFLAELEHYGREGSHYPGEPLLGVPPFHGDNSPFTRTHLIQLGEGLSPTDWDGALERVAELVYALNLTAARSALDEPAPIDDDSLPRARVCEFLSLGIGGTSVVAEYARRTALDVIRHWREGGSPAAEPNGDKTIRMSDYSTFVAGCSPRMEAAVSQKLVDCGLDFDRLDPESREVLQLEAEANMAAVVERLVSEAETHVEEVHGSEADLEFVLAAIDGPLGIELEDESADQLGEALHQRVVSRLVARTRDGVEDLLAWLARHIDDPETRLDGARQIVMAARRRVQELQSKFATLAGQRQEAAASVGITARSTTDTPTPKPTRRFPWGRKRIQDDPRTRALRTFAEHRLEQLRLRAAEKVVRIADAELSGFVDRVDRLSRSLSGIAEPLRLAGGDPALPDGTAESLQETFRHRMLARLDGQRADLARFAAEVVDQQLFGDGLGLSRFLDPNVEVAKVAGPRLLASSRRVVIESIRELAGRAVRGEEHDDDGFDLSAMIAETLPPDDTKRLPSLLVVPADPTRGGRPLDEQLDHARVYSGPTTEITLLHGRHDRPLHEIAEEAIAGQDVYRQLADRLRTRSDVSWLPFHNPTRQPGPVAPAFV